ncbi:ATPase, T2SS/T4P/T4SS family [Paenibacillus pinistramenti]|uniref:ATPase, T2SS/T4P/T4SS family n=1 Tax=Paenibacillus pinistramenti TaxID=1768003 RepID=UPI001107E944|nr:ATPase, T2SS/T4P/T4SS family [Paenibacillus pinistramenti]
MLQPGWTTLGVTALAAGALWYFRSRKIMTKTAPARFTASKHEEAEILRALNFVKQSLHDMSRNHLDDYGLSEEEYKRKRNQRAELKQALKSCGSGDPRDKMFVKNYMTDLLENGYRINNQAINRMISFDHRERLSLQDKFEIILYLFKQKYGSDALSVLIGDYALDAPKQKGDGEGNFRYEIDGEDINHIFYMEYRELDYREKLELVVQRIYQMYKGFSVIDEIRDQSIDGVSGGVSGFADTGSFEGLESMYNLGVDSGSADSSNGQRNYDSIWIFFKGKSIRLSFLSFGSEGELKRVCQNIYKYNLPGQLSEASAYKVNEMKDGSRVVVVRPPFAESWAFFVRKFDIKNISLEQLITGKGAEAAIGLLKFIMKGGRITAITGSQGSGKTTLLMAMIKHIYASYSLRIQEMSFELHLRRLYPTRNILTFRETDHITGQQGLDLQKKTDGSVNILGEVATDEVAAWMIQMSQVASLFTIFTHHAKTFNDLIQSLRNSLLKTGMFRDDRTAEKQVIRAVTFDVHMRHGMDGTRYIERITECVPLKDHPDLYEARNIIVYRNGEYLAEEPLSMHTRQEMKEEMIDEDAAQFDQFIAAYWGEQIGA